MEKKRSVFEKCLTLLQQLETFLPYAIVVYNLTEHTSTKYQPYAVLYGRIQKYQKKKSNL